MKFIHMSHTDLDGYSCQLISKIIYPDGLYYNVNYGIEIKDTITTILSIIDKCDEDIFFLISDLSLTIEESFYLNKRIDALNTIKNIKLLLLDHHIDGKYTSKKYNWYYLDISKCATKQVFEYFLKNYKNFSSLISKNIIKYIEIVDTIDLWKKNSDFFEIGKVLINMMTHSNEISYIMFPDENRQYKLFLIKKFIKLIHNSHILLEEKIYNLKKEFFTINDKPNSLDNLCSEYINNLLMQNKKKITILYKKHKGVLTYNIYNIAVVADKFFEKNIDYSFFIDIDSNGVMHFRSNGEIDVSLLAKNIADGGGHPNASGARIKNWHTFTKYSDVKHYILKLL